MNRLFSVVLIFSLALAASAEVDEKSARQANVKQAATQLVMEGNSRGATGCVACHGVTGMGQPQAGYPRLAGLSVSYQLAQLEAFKSGARKSELMRRIASALSDEEARLATEYFAALEASSNDQAAQVKQAIDQAVLDHGRWLAEVGKWEKGIPACGRCHGAEGRGVPPDFPPLAGQPQSYIEQQLRRWQAGERKNDPLGLMEAVAKALDDEDIQAVAAWFAARETGPQLAAGLERTEQADFGQEAADQEKADQGDQGLLETLQAPGKVISALTGADKPDQEHSQAQGYQPPGEAAIPDDELGEAVLLGKRIFVETKKYAPAYVGAKSEVSCVNCHLDRGRHPASGSMGAAFVRYPMYRKKDEKISTIQDRIEGCFKYSMNGKPPPVDSKEMTALVSYLHWLAQGIKVADKPAAAGYPELAKPAQAPDPERGAAVFVENCAICHGANGEGTVLAGRYQFPPLWGDHTYNWGAGMHEIDKAAGFIKYNMPLGNPKLSLQAAWDVAAYINSHEHPQDPRFAGDLAVTREKYHQHQCYYGKTQWGKTLGVAGQGGPAETGSGPAQAGGQIEPDPSSEEQGGT